jgi:beta-glucosidase
MPRRHHERFRWGVAGSAFQSEGHLPRCNWQGYLSDGKHPGLEPYGDSVDFRHRYREDIALAKDRVRSTKKHGRSTETSSQQ